MKERRVEIMVGLFMLAGIVAFAVLAFKISGLTFLENGKAYHVTAEFEHIGDLKVRAPVTMAGVAIGRVTGIGLNQNSFKAQVNLEINQQYDHIPTDSTANIYTAGLIGSNYISIIPGFEENYLKEGSQIENTNQALILQNIIGQFMFYLKGNDGKPAEEIDG